MGTLWQWPWDHEADSLSVRVTLHNNPSEMRRGGLYLIGCTGFAIAGQGAYFGIQTDVNDPARGDQGRGAIFSRWYDHNEPWPVRHADTRIPADGWIEAGDYEGDFISVRSKYPWRDGVYRMEIRGAERNADGQWFEYWVVDGDGVETWIGSLRFPLEGDGKARLHPGCFTALEAYGYYLRPVEIPYWNVTVDPPVMGGLAADLDQVCYPRNVENLRNAHAEYDEVEGVVKYEVGLDYLAHDLDPSTVCP